MPPRKGKRRKQIIGAVGLTALLTAVWAVHFHERDPGEDYSSRMVGALVFIEQQIESRSDEIFDADPFVAPVGTEGSQARTLRLAGSVRIRSSPEADGRERQSVEEFRAVVETLCNAYGDSGCWKLRSLTVGGATLVAEGGAPEPVSNSGQQASAATQKPDPGPNESANPTQLLAEPPAPKHETQEIFIARGPQLAEAIAAQPRRHADLWDELSDMSGDAGVEAGGPQAVAETVDTPATGEVSRAVAESDPPAAPIPEIAAPEPERTESDVSRAAAPPGPGSSERAADVADTAGEQAADSADATADATPPALALPVAPRSMPPPATNKPAGGENVPSPPSGEEPSEAAFAASIAEERTSRSAADRPAQEILSGEDADRIASDESLQAALSGTGQDATSAVLPPPSPARGEAVDENVNAEGRSGYGAGRGPDYRETVRTQLAVSDFPAERGVPKRQPAESPASDGSAMEAAEPSATVEASETGAAHPGQRRLPPAMEPDVLYERWRGPASELAALPPEPEARAEAALTRDEREEIERLLSLLGFVPGPVDGTIDSDSEDAIRNYQDFAALPTDGTADRTLLTELRQLEQVVAELHGSREPVAPEAVPEDPAAASEQSATDVAGGRVQETIDIAEAPRAEAQARLEALPVIPPRKPERARAPADESELDKPVATASAESASVAPKPLVPKLNAALASGSLPAYVRQALQTGLLDIHLADGHTPLSSAVAEGQQDAVVALLGYGANPNVVTDDKATPLMYAAWAGDLESAKLLLDAGALPNQKNLDGKTALMAAAANGHADVVEILLKYGAAPDLQALKGWTALMYAAWRDQQEIVQLLLEHGANVMIENDRGETVVDLAAERQHSGIHSLLLTTKGAS